MTYSSTVQLLFFFHLVKHTGIQRRGRVHSRGTAVVVRTRGLTLEQSHSSGCICTASFVKNGFRIGCPLTCLSRKMFQELRQFVLFKQALFKQALNQCAPFGAGGCGDSRSICVCCMHRERTIGTGGFVYLLLNQATRQLDFVSCACALLAIDH